MRRGGDGERGRWGEKFCNFTSKRVLSCYIDLLSVFPLAPYAPAQDSSLINDFDILGLLDVLDSTVQKKP